MTNLLDNILGNQPKAHENIDKEINKNSILGALGLTTGVIETLGEPKPFGEWTKPFRDKRGPRPNIFDEAKTPEGKKVLNKINKMNKMGMTSKLPKTPIIAALLTGGGIGTALNKKFGLSGKIAEYLRPDPEIDMNTINKNLEQEYYGLTQGDKIKQNEINENLFRALLGKEGKIDSLKQSEGGMPYYEGLDDNLLQMLEELENESRTPDMNWSK